MYFFTQIKLSTAMPLEFYKRPHLNIPSSWNISIFYLLDPSFMSAEKARLCLLALRSVGKVKYSPFTKTTRWKIRLDTTLCSNSVGSWRSRRYICHNVNFTNCYVYKAIHFSVLLVQTWYTRNKQKLTYKYIVLFYYIWIKN
jgi:hypothetical protein